MSLTEVIFELGDPQYLLCRFTQANPGTRCIFRVVDLGHSTGVFRVALTVLGGSEATAPLVKEMRASGRYDELEIASITPYGALIRIGHRLTESRERAGIAVGPVERLLAAFGNDTILEPFVIEAGRIRARCLIPQALETKRTLLTLQEIQRTMGWQYFRVIRVAEFKAVKYADVMRRLLSPEQEELLRLALSLGYYDSPKRCTLETIAAKVSLSVSPVHKKLKTVEQVLINAHVEPTSVPAADLRRARRNGPAVPEAAPAFTEVTVRLSWPTFAPAQFASEHLGSRVIFQPLSEDARVGLASSLLVAVTPAASQRALLEAYAKLTHVRDTEVVSRDEDHVSLKIRTGFPMDGVWRDHPNPFPHLVRKFGQDAYFKPVIAEGRDVWMRLVLTRQTSLADFTTRLENVGLELGWAHFEITSTRRLELDQTSIPIAQPEKMTPRQEEVLKIAHALGYYKTPRECTLEHVAGTLGISANAIHKNLTAAEEKIICSYLAASS